MYVIYSLEGCPYSQKANRIFAGKAKIIPISQNDKHNYKQLMNSFPQIYYVTKKDACLLGGISDFVDMVKTGEPEFIISPKKINTIDKIKNTFNNFDIY